MGGPEVGGHGGMGAQGDKGTKNMGERTDEGHGGRGDTWGPEGTEGHRRNEGVEVPPRPPSPARLLSCASARWSPRARPRRRPWQARPASRPPPAALDPGLPSAPGLQRRPEGGARPARVRARSGARLTSASCRGAPASRPQPTVQTFGRGVRRPSPAATPARAGASAPQPPPQQSASRASSTAAAAVVAALPPGGAGTWEGGAAAPGARPPDPGLGALTSASLQNPLCRPSPGTPSRPAGSDFARSSWFYAEGKREGRLHTLPSLHSPRRFSGIFLKARPEGPGRS